jgi:pseudouridine synthase
MWPRKVPSQFIGVLFLFTQTFSLRLNAHLRITARHPFQILCCSQQQSGGGNQERTVVLLYYKPPNVVTSHSNQDHSPESTNSRERITVYDDILSLNGFIGKRGYADSFEKITGIQSKLHAIGRLDAETSGLLLLTNDGGLVHHATNPKAYGHNESQITKTYEAVIMGYLEMDSNQLMRIRHEGVDIGSKYGGKTMPAKNLKVLSHPTAKSTLVSITLAEGKNRQVRRMFHAVQSGVMQLKRTQIGDDLCLEGLQEGQWRILSDVEVEKSLGWTPRSLSRIPFQGTGYMANSKGRPRRVGKKQR